VLFRSVKVLVSQPGLITVDPSEFTVSPGSSLSVAVSLNSKHPFDIPFTVVITYSVQSDGSNTPIGTLSPSTGIASYSPPVAVKNAYAIQGKDTFVLNVRDNDTDRLGRGLSLGVNAIVVPPGRGKASVENGKILYTPDSNKNGSDTFYYQVTDDIGNTSIGKIHIIQLPPNAKKPSILTVSEDEGGIATTDDGNATFDIPGLTNVIRMSNVALPNNIEAEPDNDIDCGYSELTSSNGNPDSAPLSHAVLTGLNFYLQCYADDQPITEDMLPQPVGIVLKLADDFKQQYQGAHLSTLNWDGARWHSDGVNIVSAPNSPALNVQTTLFGEFAVFGQHRSNIPFVSAGQ